MSFEGQGAGQSIIKGAITYQSNVDEPESGASITVSGLTVTYDRAYDTQMGICVASGSVRSLTVSNVAIDGFQYGVAVNSAAQKCAVSVSGLMLNNTWCALSVAEREGNSIDRCEIADPGNSIYAIQSWAGHGVTDSKGNYYSTADDYFTDLEDNTLNNPSVVGSIAEQSRPATGTTAAVVATVNGKNYDNLQLAVDAAPADATVQLAAGIIDIPKANDGKIVYLSKPITIKGSGEGTTIEGAIWTTNANEINGPINIQDVNFKYTDGAGNQGVCVRTGTDEVNITDCSFDGYLFAVGNGSSKGCTLNIQRVKMTNVWCGVGFDETNSNKLFLSVTEGSTVIYEVQGFDDSGHNGYYLTYEDYAADIDSENNNGSNVQVPSLGAEYGSKAVVGQTSFETLEAAMAAAKKGETIKLTSNVEVSSILTLSTPGVTLNLNGYTITGPNEVKNDDSSTTNDNHLIDITADGVTITNGTLVAGAGNNHTLNVWNAKDVTIDNVTLDNSKAGMGGAPLIVGASDVTVTGTLNVVTGGNSWYGINVDSRYTGAGNTSAKNGSLTFGEGATANFTGISTTGVYLEETAGLPVDVTFEPSVTFASSIDGFVPVVRAAKATDSTVTNPENAGIGFDQDGSLHVHSLDVTSVPYKAPTATKPGNYAYWVCNTCHKLFKDAACTQETTLSEMTIPATGVVKPTYTATVTESEHGTVKVTPERAKASDDVIITATPDEGFKVSKVSVADKGGKDVKVSANADGTYSFEMPSGGATVTVEFACDGGELCPSHGLVDVEPGEWYHEAVDWAVKNGVMTGYDDGTHTFGPDDSLTRAQLAATLYKKAGQPAVDGSKVEAYSDCDSDAWYAKAVAWATQQGLMTGYSDGSGRFAPDAELTREQLAIVFWRIAGEPAAEADLAQFPDGSETSPWAEVAVEWAVSTGLLQGYDNTGELDPAGSLTRAQTATVFMREADAD